MFRTVHVVVIGIMMQTICFAAEEITPEELMKKVKTAYDAVDTYTFKGTIVADIDTGKMKVKTTTTFSIKLKKPNMYLISWSQENPMMPGMVQSGAVWSDGTQPYLFMGMMNSYSKIANDMMALASATGISGGAAWTIPMLFLPIQEQTMGLLGRIKEPKIIKSEMVGDDDCYVVAGASAISKQESFWISKENYLIRKHKRLLATPDGGMKMPEVTDEQIVETLKGMGQEVTEESKKKMKEMMAKSRAAVKTMNLNGSTEEIHNDISSPKLTKADFRYELPAGAAEKASLFGAMLDKQKRATEELRKTKATNNTSNGEDNALEIDTKGNPLLAGAIKKAKQEKKTFVDGIWRGRGNVLIGKLKVEGSDDLKGVSSRTRILKGGYFAAAVYPGQTVTFCKHGYDPLDIRVKSGSKKIADIGEVVLKKAAQETLKTLSAKMQLPEGVAEAKATLFVDYPPRLWADQGHEMGARPQRRVGSKVVKQGEQLSLEGLSGIEYELRINAKGCIEKRIEISREAKQQHDLGVVVLLPAVSAHFTYVDLKFAKKPNAPRIMKKTVLCDGKAEFNYTKDRDKYGQTQEIRISPKKDGTIEAYFSYPSTLYDLGVVDLKEKLDTFERDKVVAGVDGSREVKLINNHTYYFDCEDMKTSCLFHVRLSQGAKDNTPERNVF